MKHFMGCMIALGLSMHPGQAPAAEAARRPNVVLIVIDTLRQDHLGCYGSERNTSPAIDALASEATRFTRAYSTAPWTLPSVASMITGRYPAGHGATRIGLRLSDDAVTLSEMLGTEGYATAAVISHSILSARWGFAQGYDTYLESEARGPNHVSTPGVTGQALDLLTTLAASERPFFLFVHYFDPHHNYMRHPEHGFAPPSAGRLTGDEPITILRAMMEWLTGEEIRFIQALYDEEIRETDQGVGRLAAAMKELGVDKDTLLVVTSDHGEEFMTHGWLGHSRTLYEELVKVPLILRPPGGAAGRVVDAPVSLAALAPSILQLVGIDLPEGLFQERSFAPLLLGGGAEDGATAFFEVDYTGHRQMDPYGPAHKRGIVTSRFKLIRDDRLDRYELFDLAADPEETENLAASRPELLRQLLPILERRIALSRGDSASAEPLPLTEEEIEALRSLGYIGP